MTVLSTRTSSPLSSLFCRALASNTRLISSQVSARIALILPAGFLETVPMQVPRYQAQKIAMLVQPLRHRFQFSADLVFGEVG